MKRDSIDSVLRSLRKVNLQGSFFGQTVAIRFGLSESDIETLEALIDMGASTAGRLAELTGLTSGAVTRVIDRLEQAGYVGRYTDAQLALISDFLTRMEQITRDEATNLREHAPGPTEGEQSSEHSAPLAGLTSARLLIRSGLSEVRLRPGTSPTELYRAEFRGATPQVRLRDGRVIVQYRGISFDWRKRTATFGLNATIPWAFEVVGGVGRIQADLREIQTTRFEITGGSQDVQLELGTPRGEAGIRFVGGASTIRLGPG